jgi:HK97 family phage portal protein
MRNRLRSIFRKSASSSLSNPEPWLRELFSGGAISISGQTVSPTTAMRVPAVYSAVAQISEAIGNLPVFVFRRGEGGARDRAPDHPAYGLVHDDASEFVSAGALREQLVIDALLHGNGVAYVVRVDGKPIEIIRLKPDAVTIAEDDLTGEARFTVRGRDGSRVLDRRDVLHVPALSIDGVKGAAPIQTAREAIALASILEEHAVRLFANGAKPSGVLSTEKTLTPQAVENIRKIVEAQNSGVANAGKTLVVPDGLKYAAMALNSVDSQFAEMRNFQNVEIARAFKIPLVFLQDYSRATWGNSETMARLFLQYTLAPWIDRLEAAYRHALIPQDQRDEYFIEFSVDELLKADTQARAAAYASFRTSGVMTANEVRRREGLPDRPDGDTLANPATSSPDRAAQPEKEEAA